MPLRDSLGLETPSLLLSPSFHLHVLNKAGALGLLPAAGQLTLSPDTTPWEEWEPCFSLFVSWLHVNYGPN
jgi:hypothetical protein